MDWWNCSHGPISHRLAWASSASYTKKPSSAGVGRGKRDHGLLPPWLVAPLAPIAKPCWLRALGGPVRHVADRPVLAPPSWGCCLLATPNKHSPPSAIGHHWPKSSVLASGKRSCLGVQPCDQTWLPHSLGRDCCFALPALCALCSCLNQSATPPNQQSPSARREDTTSTWRFGVRTMASIAFKLCRFPYTNTGLLDPLHCSQSHSPPHSRFSPGEPIHSMWSGPRIG